MNSLSLSLPSVSVSVSVSPSVSLPLSSSLLLVKERQVSLVWPLSFQAASQQNEAYQEYINIKPIVRG